MRSVRRLRWFAAFALFLIGGWLLVTRTREAAPAASTPRAVGTEWSRAEVSVDGLANHAHLAQQEPIIAPPLVAAPPGAECIAGRTRDAKRNAELAAMSPAEVEAHVGAEARKPRAPDSLFTRAAEACRNVSGHERTKCQGQQFAALYMESELDERAAHEALRSHARLVASRGDARSLLGAAEILPVGVASAAAGERPSGLGRSREAVEWVVRAQQLGRNDALVQWSVVAFKHKGADGESAELRRAQRAAIQRLQTLEPDNVAAYLLAASTKEDGSTRLLTPAQIERAAAMPRFSEPVAARIALGLEALRGVPALPAFRRVALRANRDHDTATHCASPADLIQQMHLAERRVFQKMHLLTPLAFACTPDGAESAESVWNACPRLFERAYAGAQTLDERDHAASSARILAKAPTRRLHWERIQRRAYWQTMQYRMLERQSDPYVAAHFAAEGWRSGSEIIGMEALLRSRGVPLDPPEGWKMPGEP